MRLSVLLLISLAFLQDTGVLSREKEIALGRLLSAEIERDSNLVEDPAITGYVDRIGQNLARHAAIDLPVVIKVIESRVARAAALPGGYLFIGSGLVAESGTEAELAAVMAHEMAHIAARHGMRADATFPAPDAGNMPIVFASGPGGICTRLGSPSAVPLAFRSLSERFEEEADLLGLQYLEQAGYDPSALVEIFRKLNSAPPQSIIEKSRELTRPSRDYVVTTSEFRETQRRLAVLFLSPRLAPPSLETAR